MIYVGFGPMLITLIMKQVVYVACGMPSIALEIMLTSSSAAQFQKYPKTMPLIR